MQVKDVVEQTVSSLKKDRRKSWKLHETTDELQKWSAYLQQSAERFIEELEKFGSNSVFVTTSEANAYQDTLGSLQILKKESTLLKSRSRRLHGPRR